MVAPPILHYYRSIPVIIIPVIKITFIMHVITLVIPIFDVSVGYRLKAYSKGLSFFTKPLNT